MARIKRYDIDIQLNDDDKLLCTDASDSSKSKLITLADLKNYIIPPGGQPGQVLKSDGAGGIYWE